MKKVAIISVILKDSQRSQTAFYDIVFECHEIIQGRMRILYKKCTIALISLI